MASDCQTRFVEWKRQQLRIGLALNAAGTTACIGVLLA